MKVLVKGWIGKVGWFTELELLATYSLHIIKKDDSIGIHQKKWLLLGAKVTLVITMIHNPPFLENIITQ